MMSELRPKPPTHHDSPKVFIHPDMKTTKFVFVRDDTSKKPLQSPYRGPYEVLDRNEKVFKIVIKGKQETVSIDRLKPAFILDFDSNQILTPTNKKIVENNIPPKRTKENVSGESHTTTRSGRNVKFPDRLTY